MKHDSMVEHLVPEVRFASCPGEVAGISGAVYPDVKRVFSPAYRGDPCILYMAVIETVGNAQQRRQGFDFPGKSPSVTRFAPLFRVKENDAGDGPEVRFAQTVDAFFGDDVGALPGMLPG